MSIIHHLAKQKHKASEGQSSNSETHDGVILQDNPTVAGPPTVRREENWAGMSRY